MKQSRIRGILAGAAAVALIGGTVAPALANTELVPASRLIAPFLDISSGRDTFYMLVNVSQNVNLNRVLFAPGDRLGPWGVHLEHYGQSCDRIDESTGLTPGDIDQFDLLVNSVARTSLGSGQPLGAVTPSVTQSGVAGRGWTDIDVRFGPGTLTGSTSIQANVLLGTAIISDFGSDYAFAYPMASVIGTSNRLISGGTTAGGIGSRIVRRTSAGQATEWTGRYEPLPRRLFVPVYFADGTQASSGETFSSFLVIAGPPDGNWDGSGDGEAPGQATGKGAVGPANLSLATILWDGCEQNVSPGFTSHFLNNTYATLFGTTVNRSTWQNAVPSNPNGCPAVFASRDELSGQALGWIDIINNAVACDQTSNGTAGCAVGGPNTPAVTLSGTDTTNGSGTARARGMVGISVSNVTTSTLQLGDVTRLWGDASPWGNIGNDANISKPLICSNGVACQYSLVDEVNHVDVDQTGTLTVTNSVSEQ